MQQIGVFLIERNGHLRDIRRSVRRFVHFILLHKASVFWRCIERIKRRVVIQMDQCSLIEIERRLHRIEAESTAHERRRTHISWSWIDKNRSVHTRSASNLEVDPTEPSYVACDVDGHADHGQPLLLLLLSGQIWIPIHAHR